MQSRIPADRHNLEIQRNIQSWHRKPLMQKVYHGFYRRIAGEIDASIPGPVVELGSGMGRIKDVIPQCVTTDIFKNPWLDRIENCYELSFDNDSVSHLILFDVWHHLRYPGTALREFHRVLAPGGRLILFEPAASWIGRAVYHYFHHEPVALREPITWFAPSDFKSADIDYYAAQGSATRLFWWREAKGKLDGWNLPRVYPLPAFEYFATGGFSGPQLGGRIFHGITRVLDRIAAPIPKVFAGRLLICIEKKSLSCGNK